MTTFTCLGRRLAECGGILAMLLAVTILADFVSDRLGINALLGGGTTPEQFEAMRFVDLVQAATIFVALVFGLLGWNVVLRRLSIVTIGLVTFGLIVRVVALIVTLPRQPHASAFVLLTDGFMLWLMNLLVFAAWYWLIDTGGHFRAGPLDGQRHDLLFPQQTAGLLEWKDWQPEPVDYLYVAFNANTAFSPTDTVFLTRRAKLLLMCQAMTALVIVTVIFARAINAIQ